MTISQSPLAAELGLLAPEVLPSRHGPATLRLAGAWLLSAYDPMKEAERLAAGVPGPTVRVVGLGLGYLAAALGERLSGVLAFQGEAERFRAIQTGTNLPRALGTKIIECVSLRSLEQHLARAVLTGEMVLFDSVLQANPHLLDRLQALVETARLRPSIAVIHLKTAGDVIRSLAAVQAFRRQEPRLAVRFLTGRPYGALARLAEDIDEVIELAPGESPPAALRPLLAFNFGGEAEAGAIVTALDPVWAAGYLPDGEGMSLQDERQPTHAEQLRQLKNRMNRYHLYFAVMGLSPLSEAPRLKVAATPVPGEYRVVQFGAGSGAAVWEAKRLAPSLIAEVSRRSGGRWLAVGGADEAALAREAGIPEGANFCGRTTWPELAAILAGARFFLGHDSGPTHLAAALGIPTLALFGFTSPILNAPIGPRAWLLQADLDCAFSGCPRACPERTCTRVFTADVIMAAQRLVESATVGEQLEAAAEIRAAGFRYFPPGTNVEHPDPLGHLLQDEPRLGPPHDSALALAREWLETKARF